jgi:hypothetical protein
MTDLERELQALSPVRPSPRLADRLATAVTAPIVVYPRWPAWVWPALAAAALLVFVLRPPAPTDEFRPVRVDQFVFGSETGEVYLAADHTWRRDVRRWSVEQQRWERATDQAWIEVSVPREEIISLTVALY